MSELARPAPTDYDRTGIPSPIGKMNRSAKPEKPRQKSLTGSLFGPGFGNICLCYLLIVSTFLSPLALLFAFLFAEPHETRFHAHYFYIRTTVALFVIGFCAGCLMIVLGADISSTLILTGLVLLAFTIVVTLARCARGILSAMRGKAPQNYKSYFI
ncbi:MAG: hypothetical protein K5905_14525 [Roseibium sp.]|uniref:hypothetical protein n=1 Tax=Roseibium sp. TaxID=1936156 RepID=UPI002615DCA3|nr:hypothetical protein [Roseibium sp.]MCV0426681.1 hypothetical protein [Roseibium sp.]